MFPQKERSKNESDELIRALAWNDEFGCYTRQGFKKAVWPTIAEDARWIIYFDVDGVHNINATNKGYEAFDAMMKQALATLRLTDYVAAQWKSGDEFLVCLTETKHSAVSDQRETLNPEAMMERLIDALKKQGLTATFAIVPVISPDLAANVKPAVDQVYEIKNSRPSEPRS